MTDFEFETHEPIDPAELVASDLALFGIQHDLLGELSAPQARIVIGGMAKALSALTHPDNGPGRTVFGLETGDITSVHHRVKGLSDSELQAGLEKLRLQSPTTSVKRELNEVNERLQTLLEINTELSREFVLGTERVTSAAHMSLFLGSYERAIQLAKSDRRYSSESDILARESLGYGIEIHNGVITNAYEAEPSPVLIKELPAQQQKLLRRHRRSTDDEHAYVYIGENDETGLEHGWYILKNAIGPNNKPYLAAKRYLAQDERSSEVVGLRGAYLIGQFTTDAHGTAPTRLALPEESTVLPASKAAIETATVTQTIPRIQDQEMIYLMSRGLVRPFADTNELQAAQQFVFHKSPRAGSPSANFVTASVQAKQML